MKPLSIKAGSPDQRVPTKDEFLVLDYAPPQPSRAVAVIRAVGARVLLAMALFAAAVFVPHPRGIWYFGHKPQWTIAVDFAGLTVGPYADPWTLGWVPLLAMKLIVLTIPLWIAWRLLSRARAAAGERLR